MGRTVEVVDRSGYTIERRSEMGWVRWAVIGVGVAVALGVMAELPAIRRYTRMKTM